MKITLEEAQLALNAFDAHYRLGMAGGANYGRLVTIFADKLQNFINEEVAKRNGIPATPPTAPPAISEVDLVGPPPDGYPDDHRL